MLDQGLVEEVAALRRESRVHAELPSMRSVGYRQVWQFLDGEMDREQMRAAGIAASRQLAKRQITWLRREPELEWVDPTQPGWIEAAVERIARFLDIRL
jgi:tRNA dimethylallyltransferase